MSTASPQPRPTASRPTAHATASGARGLGTWPATRLVAEREIVTQVRSKAFVISTSITLFVILAGIVVASLVSGSSGNDTTPVAVVGDASEYVSPEAGFDVHHAASPEEAADMVRQGTVDAALVPDSSALGFHLLALKDTPDGLVSRLSLSPSVELLEPSETSPVLRYVISLAFGLVFMITAMSSGSTIMQNTVQEKQSRIVEILLAAVPARALLAGKILGNSVIGIGVAVAMALVSVLGLVVTGQTALLELLTLPMIWFVVFFLVGFVLVASVFAAGASLVSRQEDTGAVMTPAMVLVMLPYFGVTFFGTNPAVMEILSYVPVASSVAMPVRLFFGEAGWWEPVLSLVIVVLATTGVTMLAARIYSGSLLHTGARVKVRDALRPR